MGVLTIRQNNSSGSVIHTENRLVAPTGTWKNPTSSGATWNCKDTMQDRNIVIGGKTFNCKDTMMPYGLWAKYDTSQPLVVFDNGTWGSGYSTGSFSCYGYWHGASRTFTASLSVSGQKLRANFPQACYDHSSEWRDEYDIMSGVIKLNTGLPVSSVASVSIKFSGNGVYEVRPTALLINKDMTDVGNLKLNWHASSPDYNPYWAWEYLYATSNAWTISNFSPTTAQGDRKIRASSYGTVVSSGGSATYTLTPTVVSGDTNLWLYISSHVHYGKVSTAGFVYIDYIKINTK